MYGDQDWNTTSSLKKNPYYFSKTLAEKAAHEFVKTEAPAFSLVVINPFTVLGPALDTAAEPNTSVTKILLPLAGEQPTCLPLSEALVDVRDVAEMHVRGIEVEAAAGRRFLGVARSEGMSNREMCKIVKAAAPAPLKHRVPTMLVPPNFVVLLFARLTQPKGARDYIETNVGKFPRFDNSSAVDVLGVRFRDPADTVRDTVEWLVANKKVL